MRHLLRRVLSRPESRELNERLLVGPNGWTCHVCKRYRPDDRISVWSTMHTVNGVKIRTNVRYCNDRVACLEGAPHINFLEGATNAD